MTEANNLRATSYIITYRATNDPARRANLETVLAWLKPQPLAEVIVVEQDEAPTLGDFKSFPGLRSLFAYNPGPFNKSWGFNIGVRASTGSLLAFGDADVLCRTLPAAVSAARSDSLVVRAFSAHRSRRRPVGHAARRTCPALTIRASARPRRSPAIG